MGRNTRLAAVLLLLALAGLLVWQLASRREERATGRADPIRVEPPVEEKGPEPPAPEPAPEPAPAAEDAESLPQPPMDEGIRVRVVAEGNPVTDAQVYAYEDETLHELGHEGEGLYFAGVTGRIEVGAAHATFGPVRREIEAEAGEITELTLELPAGETLDVLVVADAGGAPVAGALVHVIRAGGPGLDGPNYGAGLDAGEEDFDLGLFGALELTDLVQLGGLPAVAVPRLATDATGRVRIGGLPKGTVDVVVTHKEFVASRLAGRPAGGEVVVRLSSGGSLTVLAPYVDGRAAEGYVCGVIRPGLMLSMPVAAADVEASGKAFFPHLPPGPLRVVVAKLKHPTMLMGFGMGGMVVTEEEGEVPAEGEEEVEQAPKPLAEGSVVIATGEHKTLDLREAKGARIEGVFVAGDEEREGAMVFLLSGERQVATRMIGAKGEFAFDLVEPGTYRVSAVGGVGGIARADVEVREGDEVLKVRLEFPKGAILGRVLGADGKPAKGARVLVAPRDGVGQAASIADLMEQLAGFDETDEEGRFRVQGVAPGEYRVLGAVGPRLDVVQVTVREREEVSVELRVDDARVRRLAVGLRGPDGPVEGSVVVLGPGGGAAETFALTPDEEIAEPARRARHEFFLAPGLYRLVAEAEGLAPALGEPVDVSGDREVTLTLVPGVRVDLVFEGEKGPVANRDVDVRNEHGIRLDVSSPMEMLIGGGGLRTDGSGILSLAAVPPGRYAVSVGGRERARFEVAATPLTKRIRLE